MHLEYDGGSVYLPVYRIGEVQRYLGGEAGDGPARQAGRRRPGRRSAAASRPRRSKIAEELLQLYAQRAALAGHAFPRARRGVPRVRGDVPVRGDARSGEGDRDRARPTCRTACRWIAWSAATSATARPRSRCAPACWRCWAASRWRCWRRRRCSPSSTSSPSPSASPTSRCASRRCRASAARPSSRRRWRRSPTGKIDVVVGTHRLLSRDVRFKDLGLLVIDEEQRFGVTHKERLKELRTQVDVLTLTATPIPRTLHMAMGGLREISIIATPPADRLAIRTFVCRFDPTLLGERDQARAGARRAGVLRPQPRSRTSTSWPSSVARDRAGGDAHRDRPRPDAGGRAREGDGRLRRRPLRHPGLHDDHRVGPRHPARQHDDRQPRRPLRPGAALPAARAHRPLARARVLLPGRPRGRRA